MTIQASAALATTAGTQEEAEADVAFFFNDQLMTAQAGATLSMVLWSAGIRSLRHSPTEQSPRGMFCAMGVCQECVVLIEGMRQRACMVSVCEGMQVSSITPLPLHTVSAEGDPR